MKKQILFVALLMAFFAGATAKEVTGKVHCNKKGMRNVVVTDGTNFTTTDQNGIYKLDAVDNADFIYIVTPSGYVASYASGTPRFYHTLSEKSLDFELFTPCLLSAIPNQAATKHTLASKPRPSPN